MSGRLHETKKLPKLNVTRLFRQGGHSEDGSLKQGNQQTNTFLRNLSDITARLTLNAKSYAGK